jgi:hypothetical protein
MSETILTGRRDQIARITLNLVQHDGFLTNEAFHDPPACAARQAKLERLDWKQMGVYSQPRVLQEVTPSLNVGSEK